MVTNAGGKVSFKGFYGDYDVEITANGKTVNKTIRHLAKGSKEFTVEI